ncbi:hypothetical protein KIPB_006378, partial [Kipferlia bialata]|eukprot:g6378.t1
MRLNHLLHSVMCWQDPYRSIVCLTLVVSMFVYVQLGLSVFVFFAYLGMVLLAAGYVHKFMRGRKRGLEGERDSASRAQRYNDSLVERYLFQCCHFLGISPQSVAEREEDSDAGPGFDSLQSRFVTLLHTLISGFIWLDVRVSYRILIWCMCVPFIQGLTQVLPLPRLLPCLSILALIPLQQRDVTIESEGERDIGSAIESKGRGLLVQLEHYLDSGISMLSKSLTVPRVQAVADI